LTFPMVIKVCFLLSLPCQFVAKETGYEDNENYQLVPTSFSWCLIIFPPSSLASEILFIPLQWRKGFLDGKRKQPNIICVEVHHCQLQPNFTFNLQNLRLILVVNPFHSIELVCLFSSFRTVSEYNTLLPFSFFFFRAEHLCLRVRPQYAGGIWKQCFRSENASNISRSHYAGGI